MCGLFCTNNYVRTFTNLVELSVQLRTCYNSNIIIVLSYILAVFLSSMGNLLDPR